MPLWKNLEEKTVIYLDTNVLIRFFTKDNAQQAEQARQLLKSDHQLCIEDVVFPEIEYVLTRIYERSRGDVAQACTMLASRPNITIQPAVRIAIDFYSHSSLDMADCIIAASSQGETLASFDKDLLKIPGFIRYWPS